MSAGEQAMLAAATLNHAANRIETEIGLDFSGARRRQLDAALARMAAALGYQNTQDCAAWLATGEWDEARSAFCARFLTIGETYFFREPSALDLVCDYARAHAARGGPRPLRIWSAGCCTGEEPYSIAMALRRRLPRLAPGMVSILATDLNDEFLDFARAGKYRRWSFRRTAPADQAAFFRPCGDGRFEIDATLRGQIRFAHLNLASKAFPSAATGTLGMDFVFCRNVLMYFGRAQIRRVVARFHDSLVDGGWLVVNASEASADLFPGFTPVYRKDAVYFRKGVRPAAAVPPSSEPAQAVRRGAAAVAQAPATAQAPAAQPDAPMARVHALAGAGARTEALQCLRRAVEADPLSVPLMRSAALFALEHGERALARDVVRRLLYLDPDSAIGHYLYALAGDDGDRDPQVLRLLHDCRRLAAAGGADEELADTVAMWLERLQ